MVIYNSPWAVAVLFGTFLIVAAGVLAHVIRIRRLAATLDAEDAEAHVRWVDELNRYSWIVLAQLTGVLLFAGILFAAVNHSLTTPVRAPMTRGQVGARLRPRRLDSFDRFEIHGSASAAEQYRAADPLPLVPCAATPCPR